MHRPGPGPGLAPVRRALLYAAAFVAAAAVVPLATDWGGYYAPDWGWSAAALLLVAAALLVAGREARLGALDLAYLGGVAAFVCWLALSIAWSAGPDRPVLEVERGLVYVGGLGALLLLGRRRSVGPLLGALLASIAGVCAYALLTYLRPGLAPSLPQGSRLQWPFYYSNSLGIFAALGIALGAGLAASARPPLARAAAAAALPVLAPTLLLTGSRGSFVALAAGVVAALVVSRTPLRLGLALLAVAPLPAAAAAIVGTDASPPAPHAGASTAAVVVLALANGAVAWVAPATRVGLPRLPRAVAVAVALAVVAAIALAGVRYADRAYESFGTAGPPAGSGRLLSFSGSGRADFWRVALRDFRAHPLAGSGAGSYQSYWLQDRTTTFRVRDAHSLYLETMAELGVVGLALLVAALAVPLVAAARARGRPLVPVAAGAYVAFLVHAGIDWDWEMPAVTLAGLACGAALVLSARRPRRRARLPGRALATAAALAAAAFAAVGLVGSRALAQAGRDADAGDWEAVRADARRAAAWAPWSAEARRLEGEAALARGDLRAARAAFAAATGRDRRDWELWYRLSVAEEGAAREDALRRARLLDPLEPDLR